MAIKKNYNNEIGDHYIIKVKNAFRKARAIYKKYPIKAV